MEHGQPIDLTRDRGETVQAWDWGPAVAWWTRSIRLVRVETGWVVDYHATGASQARVYPSEAQARDVIQRLMAVPGADNPAVPAEVEWVERDLRLPGDS